MKLSIDELLPKVIKEGVDKLEKNGVNAQEDDFTIVQPLDDFNALTITVGNNDEGERGLKVNVNDTTIILNPIRGLISELQ